MPGISYPEYMPQTVEQALGLIRENRPESIDRALALLQNTVYSFSMKVCGHPQDAEDTMQEVLLKSLPYLPKFESSQALSVWLYKVARNRCLSKRRGQKNAVHKHLSLDELMPDGRELRELVESKELSPETRVLRGESEQSLRKAILKAPPAVPLCSGPARHGRTEYRRSGAGNWLARRNSTRSPASRTAAGAPASGADGKGWAPHAWSTRCCSDDAEALAPLPANVRCSLRLHGWPG